MFIHFYLVYVRHVLNTHLLFAPVWPPRLAQRPRQPPGSPNGNAGPGCRA